MIIKEIRTTLLRVPWVEPPRAGLSIEPFRELVVVEVETASGHVGMGYLQLLGGGLNGRAKALP